MQQQELQPISSQTDPAWPDAVPGAQPSTPARKRSPNWGGRRPGAGAPKGNLNGWRHGRNSTYHKKLAYFVSLIPEAEEAMLRIAQRRRKKDRDVQAGAAGLLAEACRRLGELILDPQSNHLESNQDFAAQLNQLRELFQQISAMQSRRGAREEHPIKAAPAAPGAAGTALR
jgi:hypothetical protein